LSFKEDDQTIDAVVVSILGQIAEIPISEMWGKWGVGKIEKRRSICRKIATQLPKKFIQK
jgi:hypothetical protein